MQTKQEILLGPSVVVAILVEVDAPASVKIPVSKRKKIEMISRSSILFIFRKFLFINIFGDFSFNRHL